MDIESDGPIPAEFSMVCFGAVVFDDRLDSVPALARHARSQDHDAFCSGCCLAHRKWSLGFGILSSGVTNARTGRLARARTRRQSGGSPRYGGVLSPERASVCFDGMQRLPFCVVVYTSIEAFVSLFSSEKDELTRSRPRRGAPRVCREVAGVGLSPQPGVAEFHRSAAV